MNHLSPTRNIGMIPFTYLMIALCLLLAGCDINITTPTSPGSLSTGGNNQCQGNCTMGSGTTGVQVFVEPDAGNRLVVDAIRGARKSVWLEIYLLSDHNVIRALEEAANRGIDVRVMLEPHPFGGGG